MKKVSDIMTGKIEFMKPENTLRQAADRMKALRVGVMPVLENNEPMGIITDRDIVVRAIADGKNPMDTQIKDIMTRDLLFVNQDDTLDKAADVMQDNKVRRLLVRDGKNQVVGMLSLGDIAVNTDNRITGEALTEISKPAEPQR